MDAISNTHLNSTGNLSDKARDFERRLSRALESDSLDSVFWTARDLVEITGQDPHLHAYQDQAMHVMLAALAMRPESVGGETHTIFRQFLFKSTPQMGEDVHHWLLRARGRSAFDLEGTGKFFTPETLPALFGQAQYESLKAFWPPSLGTPSDLNKRELSQVVVPGLDAVALEKKLMAILSKQGDSAKPDQGEPNEVAPHDLNQMYKRQPLMASDRASLAADVLAQAQTLSVAGSQVKDKFARLKQVSQQLFTKFTSLMPNIQYVASQRLEQALAARQEPTLSMPRERMR